MFARRLLIGLLIVTLVLPAMAILPSTRAQENKSPTPFAEQGPYPVGALALEAEAPLHATKMLIWYPAVYPEGQAIRPGFPLTGASPDLSGGPYPLVIYVPGWMADRVSGQWLGDHLASYGFIVMAVDPIEVQQGGYTEKAEVLRRPQDVVWQLDYAQGLTVEGGELAGMIDMEHVAVTGHSMGGFTALMAGGARLDWSFEARWCREHYDSQYSLLMQTNMCDEMSDDQAIIAPLVGLDAAQTGLWPSWGDARVDAIVTLAPPYWIGLGPEGMGSITVPLLLMAGNQDKVVPLDWNLFYGGAGSTEKALAIFEKRDHMFFLGNKHCLHFITAFLLTTLKGDTDAPAALAPDAVSFSGITYEATGF